MSDSPYLVNQYEEFDTRMKRLEERKYRAQVYKDKLDLVSSMSGIAKDKILTKENSKNLPANMKLALSLRQSLRDEEVIQEEKSMIDTMMNEELCFIANKFRSLPVLEEISRSSLATSSLVESNNEGSILQTSDSPIVKGKKEAISSKSKTKIKSKKRDSLQSESTVSSNGPLDYVSPEVQMKEIQEDVSIRFHPDNYESLDM
jgi:hypothetical protein